MPQLEFTSLEGAFVGWVHFAAFDALIGQMAVPDSLSRKATTKFHIWGLLFRVGTSWIWAISHSVTLFLAT